MCIHSGKHSYFYFSEMVNPYLRRAKHTISVGHRRKQGKKQRFYTEIRASGVVLRVIHVHLRCEVSGMLCCCCILSSDRSDPRLEKYPAGKILVLSVSFIKVLFLYFSCIY